MSQIQESYIFLISLPIFYISGACLVPYDKFYKDISITKGLSSKDMFRFLVIIEIQGENVIECYWKVYFGWKRKYKWC